MTSDLYVHEQPTVPDTLSHGSPPPAEINDIQGKKGRGRERGGEGEEKKGRRQDVNPPLGLAYECYVSAWSIVTCSMQWVMWVLRVWNPVDCKGDGSPICLSPLFSFPSFLPLPPPQGGEDIH